MKILDSCFRKYYLRLKKFLSHRAENDFGIIGADKTRVAETHAQRARSGTGYSLIPIRSHTDSPSLISVAFRCG